MVLDAEDIEMKVSGADLSSILLLKANRGISPDRPDPSKYIRSYAFLGTSHPILGRYFLRLHAGSPQPGSDRPSDAECPRKYRLYHARRRIRLGICWPSYTRQGTSRSDGSAASSRRCGSDTSVRGDIISRECPANGTLRNQYARLKQSEPSGVCNDDAAPTSGDDAQKSPGVGHDSSTSASAKLCCQG